MPRLIRIVGGIVLVVVIALAAIKFNFGDGMRLEDRSTEPSLSGDVLETVVDLDYPPGNIAVSEDERIFFTLHPDGRPPAICG